ncbi:MAG: hypothetical protein K9N49_06685 [Candidatus Marinimicrobia bacterium]|nr:hypothetical protein [Candidatus Neomarinimicrobiota bacterium]
MLGCYDFCGHYDWTFRWLRLEGGMDLLRRYWVAAISEDAQQHAAEQIVPRGVSGMDAYWGQTLAEEAPAGGYTGRIVGDRYVVEMTACPSRGFLLRNGLDFSGDYCDHCLGWIGPLMKKAGYTVHHAHNHQGQCYWEFVPAAQAQPPNPEIEALKKTLLAAWQAAGQTIDRFEQTEYLRDDPRRLCADSNQ